MPNESQCNLSACVVDARWAQGLLSVGLAQAVQPEVYSVTKAPKSCDISETSYRAYDMFRLDAGRQESWRRLPITANCLDAVNLKLNARIDMPWDTSVINNNTLNPNDTETRTTISSLMSMAASDSFLVPNVEHITTRFRLCRCHIPRRHLASPEYYHPDPG